MIDVSISNYRILSLFYSSEIRIYRYLFYTWKHQLGSDKINQEIENKFNELYERSEKIYEIILNTLKEMDACDMGNELLLLGRYQEQNNELFKVYKDMKEIIETEFKNIKKSVMN